MGETDKDRIVEWANTTDKSFSDWIDNFHFDFYPTGHPSFEYYEIVIFSNPAVYDKEEKAFKQAQIALKKIDKHLKIKEFRLHEKRAYYGQEPTFYIYVGRVEALQV